jgi:hypothetical protein
MATPDPEAGRVRSAREFFADLGPPLALAAVLLPFAGVVVRWIAFSYTPAVRFPLDLALEAPTGELVAIGLSSLIPGLLALPAVAVYGYFAPSEHHHEKSRRLNYRFKEIKPKLDEVLKELNAYKESAGPTAEIPKELRVKTEGLVSEVDRLNVEQEQLDKQRPKDPPDLTRQVEAAVEPIARVFDALTRRRRLSRALGVVYWTAVILLTPWPLSLTFFGSLLLVLILPQVARRTGRVALSQVWPLVVVVLVLAAYASGLYGDFVGNEAGTYHFAAGAQLADGRFARLGEASNRTTLMACSQQMPAVISVDDSNIITVDIESSKAHPQPFTWTTMFGALTGRGTPLGFRSPC